MGLYLEGCSNITAIRLIDNLNLMKSKRGHPPPTPRSKGGLIPSRLRKF